MSKHGYECVFVAYFAAAVKEALSTSKLVPLFTLPCSILECKAAQEEAQSLLSEGHQVMCKTEGGRNGTRNCWESISVNVNHLLSACTVSESASASPLKLGPGSEEFFYWKLLWTHYRLHKVAMFIHFAPATLQSHLPDLQKHTQTHLCSILICTRKHTPERSRGR